MYVSELINNFKNQFPDFNTVIGVSSIIKLRDKYLFTLSREKYWEKQSGRDLIGFSCVGGKIHPNEHHSQAIKREIMEETSSDIELINTNHTVYVDLEGEMTDLVLQDEVTPAIIFEQQNRGKPGEPNVKGSWYLMVLVYHLKLLDEPYPSEEVPGFILLKKSKLMAFKAKRKMLLKDLIECPEDILLQRYVPENPILYPQFTSKVMIEHDNIW